MTAIRKICLLGFGEVGRRLAADLLGAASRGQNGSESLLTISSFDRQFSHAGSAAARGLALQARVQVAASAVDAVAGCQLVISAVTAGQALEAAESVLPGLGTDTYFLDLNSVSPGTKQAIAAKVDAIGGRFVEASIMSPIEPNGFASPILLGGSYANEFLALGQQLGFSGMQFCADTVGRAAATKMCRSVMIKGMESLLAESLLAARHYGVESDVLVSLNNLFPMPDWPGLARYMISRSLEHGVRRAEEMREVTRTVAEAGIAPHMSRGCVERQDWAAQFKAALDQPELVPMLDAILQQNKSQERA